ncbi:hypothetical protein EG68_04017 [Paragonimus skrjabini miyazakii]|uniref:BHLH domain-containing protein n=1 Tax=Paragonimus skrjabini miyazakii TaxID=59628 RepID=A0A8S9YW51_9TREM|nr:hypothetical protein EG68_04017 [Paragonimus skrjabini miyazakii]
MQASKYNAVVWRVLSCLASRLTVSGGYGCRKPEEKFIVGRLMNSASSYTVSPNPYSGRKRAWTTRELASTYHPRHEPGMHVTETTTEPQFPPIKRVANERERTRTASVNDAFLMLRSLIPTEPMNRKLSKIETLRLASSYISHLHAVLVTGNDPAASAAAPIRMCAWALSDHAYRSATTTTHIKRKRPTSSRVYILCD